MRIDEKIMGEVAVLSLRGEILDDEDDFTLQQKITSLVVDGVQKVVVDMRKVHRVNSRGLSALISAVKTMRKNNGDVHFADIGRQINHIFVETKLIRTFPTYETVGRAMASFS